MLPPRTGQANLYWLKSECGSNDRINRREGAPREVFQVKENMMSSYLMVVLWDYVTTKTNQAEGKGCVIYRS